MTKDEYLDSCSTLFVVKPPGARGKSYTEASGPRDRLLRSTIEKVYNVTIPHKKEQDFVYLSTEPILQDSMNGKWQ